MGLPDLKTPANSCIVIGVYGSGALPLGLASRDSGCGLHGGQHYHLLPLLPWVCAL